MAEPDRWTLFFSPGFKGDVSCRVTPTDGHQLFNEEIVVVPESRAVAAEAERDALREVYDGVVTQMEATLKAIDEGCAKFPVGLIHLAGMAQAMRNYIQADREELDRAASVSKEEAR